MRGNGRVGDHRRVPHRGGQVAIASLLGNRNGLQHSSRGACNVGEECVRHASLDR
jgi:hypothetical protein